MTTPNHPRAAVFLLILAALTLASAPAQAAKAVRALITNWGGDSIAVVDPVEGRLVADIKTGRKPHGVDIAPDGKTIYVANEGDGTLSWIDPVKNEVTATLPVGVAPNQLITSPDGRFVFVTLNTDGAVAVVSAAERKVVKTVPVGRGPHIVMLRPDGKRLYVTSEGDMKLVEIDVGSWEVTSATPLFAWPRVLTQSKDGRKVYQTSQFRRHDGTFQRPRGALVGALRPRPRAHREHKPCPRRRHAALAAGLSRSEVERQSVSGQSALRHDLDARRRAV